MIVDTNYNVIKSSLFGGAPGQFWNSVTGDGAGPKILKNWSGIASSYI